MELGKEPGVQGLVQLGRNAIERVAQLESENSYLRAANSDGAALLHKLRDRIAALEAEKAERERQEPVAWAWDDALGCMHAHCGSRRPVWVDG